MENLDKCFNDKLWSMLLENIVNAIFNGSVDQKRQGREAVSAGFLSIISRATPQEALDVIVKLRDVYNLCCKHADIMNVLGVFDNKREN